MNCEEVISSAVEKLRFLDWLTIAAFVMSSVTWVVTIVAHRKKVKIEVLGNGLWSEQRGFPEYPKHFVRFMFMNQSRLPISIVSVELTSGEAKIICDSKGIVYVRGSGTTASSSLSLWEKRSADMPINLPGLVSANAILSFDDPEHKIEFAAIRLTLRLLTTRGEIKRKISLANLPPADKLSRS